MTTTIQSDHQLVIDKTGPSAIGAGQRITYTLQYNVTGNEPALTVVITDAVPANMMYVNDRRLPAVGGVVTWNLGNLVPGNTGTVQLVVQVVTPLADGTIINNTAFIRDAQNAPVSDSVATTVTSGHGFSLSKGDTPDPVQAGGTLVYTLNWSVGGTAVAQSVVITDALPGNTTYASLRRRRDLLAGRRHRHLEPE